MSFKYREGTRGLVVGKFCPPHNGHHYLIESALSNADKVWVLVVDSPVSGFNISAQDRAAILNEVHPEAIVRVMPDILHDDNPEYWAEYTQEFLGFTPDVVFTSESYGNPWSEALGCKHHQVDYPRAIHPVSGTMVRDHPLKYITYLKPPTRAFYVKRIAVVGAESTGTTTLSEALGKHFNTEVVPEFGRVRDERRMAKEGKPYDWPSEDFYYTAIVQQAIEDRLARSANKVLICDTNVLATHLWHERYLGYYDDRILSLALDRHHDLYIITDYEDVPAVDDGLRFEMHRRPTMQRRFIHNIKALSAPFIIATGSHEARLQQSIEAIERIMKESL